MAFKNKIHLRTTKDLNGWFMFIKGKYRLQLCGDSSRGGFWIKQYADRLGKHNLMKDLTEVFALMESEGASPFTLYELEDKTRSADTI